MNAGKPIGASQLRAGRELLAGNWNVPKCGFCDSFLFSLFYQEGFFLVVFQLFIFFLFELFYQTNNFLVRVNGLNEVNGLFSSPHCK